jgi:L-Ala-D/L-Glu epimerase / N-acetyl-D-glutamate racemase
LRPFVIARGTTNEFANLVVRVDLEGEAGYGEAAPSGKLTGESLREAATEILKWQQKPATAARALEDAEHVAGGHLRPAARSALVVAYLDALGHRRGRSLRALLNLPEGRIESSITLSLGPTAAVLAEAAARDAEGWRVFKVKLGGAYDEEVLRALRDQYPDRRIRVDANEAWTPDVAAQRLTLLERLEVELVEQPLPRDLLDETAELARRFDIPVIVDEALYDSGDALSLIERDVADGANIKLAKCGGPWEARRIVKVLRDHGWRVMMGCNLESGLGIAAAAAFAGALDYADLDAHVLLADQPFVGFSTPGGVVEAPEGPGVGVRPNPTLLLEPLQR